MKIKPENRPAGSKSRWNIIWLLFAQALLIGLMVAAKRHGQAPSTTLFIVVNIMIIPALARQLFKANGIENSDL